MMFTLERTTEIQTDRETQIKLDRQIRKRQIAGWWLSVVFFVVGFFLIFFLVLLLLLFCFSFVCCCSLQESLQEFIISQEDRRTFLVSQLIEKCGVWCRDLLSFHRPPGGLQPHPPLSPDKPVYLEKLLRSLLSMASRALEEEEKKKKAREKLPG